MLFAGLLAWNLFQTSVLTATGAIVNNAGLVKKVSFPREILALASVGSASVFFFFQAFVMVIFLVVLHWRPAFGELFLLPIALVPLLVFCSAMAIFLAAVNVYLRDTQHLVEVVVGSAWFWACPIVYSYPADRVPEAAQPPHPGVDLLLEPAHPDRAHLRAGPLRAHRPGALTIAGHALPAPARAGARGPTSSSTRSSSASRSCSCASRMVVFGRLAGNFAEEL